MWPHHTLSLHNNRYVQAFLDEGTRKILAPFHLTRTLADFHVKWSLKSIKPLHRHTVCHVTSNKAKEYVSHDPCTCYADKHIILHTKILHTPQENSLTERATRTMFDHVHAALSSSNMPLTFWEYAARDYIENHNQTPHRSNKKLSDSLWFATPVKITTHFLSDNMDT